MPSRIAHGCAQCSGYISHLDISVASCAKNAAPAWDLDIRTMDNSTKVAGAAIFKIADLNAWSEACANGVFLGSSADKRDGFIHFSARHQLQETARKHFSGQTGLILIAFDAQALGPELRWEASRGGDLFPHLYAPLPTNAALWTRPLTLGEDGAPLLPRDLD
jgi:uncharacterized protein (DUF952 family)